MKVSTSIAAALEVSLLLSGLLQAQGVITAPVSAHMDVYRAGGYDDGSDGKAPAAFTFPAAPGQVLTFSSITGSWNCGQNPLYGPDGSTTTICQPHNLDNPIGTFSGYDTTDFTGGLAGIFLEDTLPSSAPPPLRFYVNDGAAGGIQTSFTSLSPQIGQVFFIGDGLTGTGTGETQMFVVPPNATHLYLGYVDSCDNSVPGCFSNNLGSLTVTVNAQIRGLCNTGQTAEDALGCTEVLVTPNPKGGGPHVDGNWQIAYPYPSPFEGFAGPCELTQFEPAWVDTPFINWLPENASTLSEWITPYDGESPRKPGWYVYRTAFPVPPVLPGGAAPTSVKINGQLSSDNTMYAIYLESPAGSSSCSLVAGQAFPVNPPGADSSDYQQWWPFSFSNALDIAPDAVAYLYFVVLNDNNATGLRVEFFGSSIYK
jgi:hypothetical protein